MSRDFINRNISEKLDDTKTEIQMSKDILERGILEKIYPLYFADIEVENGTITNPENILDGDPNTYAEITFDTQNLPVKIHIKPKGWISTVHIFFDVGGCSEEGKTWFINLQAWNFVGSEGKDFNVNDTDRFTLDMGTNFGRAKEYQFNIIETTTTCGKIRIYGLRYIPSPTCVFTDTNGDEIDFAQNSTLEKIKYEVTSKMDSLSNFEKKFFANDYESSIASGDSIFYLITPQMLQIPPFPYSPLIYFLRFESDGDLLVHIYDKPDIADRGSDVSIMPMEIGEKI